jgi:hypothetical protein
MQFERTWMSVSRVKRATTSSFAQPAKNPNTKRELAKRFIGLGAYLASVEVRRTYAARDVKS